MENLIETLVVIYAVDKGKLKIYLKKKTEDPYKNYWMLPGLILDEEATLEDNALKVGFDMTGLTNMATFQSKTYSDIFSNKRVIDITFVAITDKGLTDIKSDADGKAWFDISELPKLAFNHEKIIKATTKEVKKKILDNYDDILLDFFPSDFTLSELQSFYENVLEKPMDRRNFHKKVVTQDLVIDTGFKISNNAGRPATLYRFNVSKMKGKRI